MTSPEVVRLMIRLGNALGKATRPSTLRAELTASVARIRSLFQAAACSCALAEADGSELRFVAADGAGAESIVGVRLPVSRGIAGWVAMSAQPIIVSDVMQDARFARNIAESTAYVPRSIMAAPLFSESGEVAGVIEVLDPSTPVTHSGRDLDVLSTLATQLASVVRLSEVYDGLGDALVRSLAGASDEQGLRPAQGEGAEDSGRNSDLDELANAFHELATTGPEGMRFATTVLNEAVTFARARR